MRLRCKKISLQIAEYTVGSKATFREFLQANEMTHEEYLEALRATLHRPTMVMKRSPAATMIYG